MPPSYTQAQVLNQMGGLPDALPFGKLFEEANGGSNSILANVFRNTMSNPNLGYDRVDQQITTGAEAYFGSSQVIADTFSVMTLTDDNWLTKVFAPIVVMPENVKKFMMSKTIFKGAMAGEVPHLGVPRLARSERHIVEATLDRIGFGYVMEHDFMNTKEGLRYHLAHLQQMANAMLEAVKHDIIYTALDAYKFERDYIKEHNLYKTFDPETYFSEQIWAFAILQKQKNGMEKMHDAINDRMQQWRGVADTYIMPPQVVRFLNLVPSENITYSEAGPAGPGRLEDSTRPWGVLNKQPVYVARSYFSTTMDGTRQWLQNRAQFGEWYRMSNPTYSPDYVYRSDHRNIKIYSFPRKGFVEIKLRDAFNYSMLFDHSTGLPMYLDNPNFPYQTHMDAKHAQKDIFNYKTVVNGRTVYKNAHFFGEMELHYFTPQDKINMARSVLTALKDKLADCPRTICDFNDGLHLLRRIQRLPHNREAAAEFFKIESNAAGVAASPRGLNNISNLIEVGEFRQDPNDGSLLLDDGSGYVLERLIPGLQSESGLRFLIRYGAESLSKEKALAERFLAAVQDIANYVEQFFPGNALTSTAYASPVQHYPTPSSALIDNLLLNGYNPPIYFARGNAGANVLALDRAIQQALLPWTGTTKIDIDQAETNAQHGGNDPSGKRAFYVLAATLSVAFQAGLDTAGSAAERRSRRQRLIQLFSMTRVGRDEAGDPDTGEYVFELDRYRGMSSRNIGAAVNRLVQQALADPEIGPFFGALQAEADREDFISQLVEAAERLSRGGEEPEQVWVRTPLLASSAYAASLYAMRKEDNSTPYTIGDPRFPEIPASLEILDEVTRFYPERTDVSRADRDAAGRDLQEFNPAWNPRVSEKFPIGSNALFNNIMTGHFAMTLNDTLSLPVEEEVQVGEIVHDEIPLRSQGARFAEEYSRGAQLFPGFRPDAVAAPNATLSRLMRLGDRFFARSFSTSWKKIEETVESPLIKAFAHIYDATPIHRDAVLSWIDNNIRIPFDLLVCRPLIEVLTLTIIKAKAGRDTIITAMAPGQFETGDDPTTQWHVGSVTGRHKCMILSPENFYIWKNAFICGVKGGLGTEPITPADYDQGRGKFQHQDIMVIPLSPRDRINSNILSLTGDLAIAETSGLNLAKHGRYQHANVARVNKAWGFNAARFGINEEESAVDAEVVASFPNVLCHAGPHLTVNPRTGDFTVYNKGESYLTGLIYDNCANVLMGRMEELDRDPWINFEIGQIQH